MPGKTITVLPPTFSFRLQSCLASVWFLSTPRQCTLFRRFFLSFLSSALFLFPNPSHRSMIFLGSPPDIFRPVFVFNASKYILIPAVQFCLLDVNCLMSENKFSLLTFRVHSKNHIDSQIYHHQIDFHVLSTNCPQSEVVSHQSFGWLLKLNFCVSTQFSCCRLEPSVAAEDRCRFEQGHSTILTLMVFNTQGCPAFFVTFFYHKSSCVREQALFGLCLAQNSCVRRCFLVSHFPQLFNFLA